MSPRLDADVGRSHDDHGRAAHTTRDACIRVRPDIAVSDIVSSRHDIVSFFPMSDPRFVISAFERFESVFRRAPSPAVCTRLALSGNYSAWHSRVLFLEFHAYDEVPVQSSPINLGLQLADLIRQRMLVVPITVQIIIIIIIWIIVLVP